MNEFFIFFSGVILTWVFIASFYKNKCKNPQEKTVILKVLRDFVDKPPEDQDRIDLLEGIPEFEGYNYITLRKITYYEYGEEISNRTTLSCKYVYDDYTAGWDDGYGDG